MEALATHTSTIAPTTATEVLEGTVPKQEAPKEDRLAPKFQMLLQRERTAVDRERGIKSKEEQLAQKLRELEEKEQRINDFYSVKDKDPKKALELLGLSYQDLTNVMLADGQIPPEVEVKRVESKLDNFLKNQQLTEERRIQDQKAKEEEDEKRMIGEFKTEIGDYIKENADRYELIRFENSDELVYDVIDGHYERTKDPETGIGKILTIAQAADKVEAYLEQKYDKARTLKKMQALLAPRPDPIAKTPTNTESQKPKTLTNNLSATQQRPITGPITDDERIRRAIAYANSLKK